MVRPHDQGLVSENRRLRRENAALRRENAALKKRVADLLAALAEAQRQAKRQAAPFSKGAPKKNPKKPGRKAGAGYGKKAHRPPPAAEQIDEFYEAPLPESCPHCSGSVQEEKIVAQYQVEIPRRPIYRQFNVHVGHCQKCGRRVQGSHPLQTSAGLGAAASQLGPDAQSAVAFLNKYGGLSHGKIQRVFSELFGISLSRGGSAHIVLRAGRRCRPVYEQIKSSVRRSPWVVPDETGWKVAGRRSWLHVLVGDHATCFRISRCRAAEVAADVLEWGYGGVLIHDGLSSYDRFGKARHQQCLRHVLHRARRLLKTAVGGAVHFPRQVIALLEQALALREDHKAGKLSADDLAEAFLGLVWQLEKMTQHRKQNAANDRLARHLRKHRWNWFWFLLEPGIDATNYRAEQALRLGVINRKVWGGNRTDPGTDAQQILMSVTATCFRQRLCPVDFISQVLRRWSPQLIPP